MSVKDLAEKLELRAKDLIAFLLTKGVMATVNQTLDEFRGVFLADKPVCSLLHEHRRRIHGAEGDARIAADALLVHIHDHGYAGKRIVD